MKIGIVHVTATFQMGGSENYVWRLAGFLSSRGHDVHLWGGAVSDPIIGDPAVTLRTAPFTPRERVWNFGTRFRKLGERLSFGWHARTALCAERYPVVNVHKPYDLPLAYWLKRKTGCRIVWRCHGTDFYPGLRLLLKQVDAIYSVSQFARDTLTRTYPVRSEVIYTGVDTAFFDPANESVSPEPVPSILYFGRLEGWKGVRHLIQALASIQGSSWTARIVGDGPEGPALGHLAGQLGLGGRVQTLPAVRSRTQVRRLLAESDLVVFPSVADETFSNALLEAMSMGRAVLVTNAGGFPEAVQHGTNGWMVPARDEAALAAGLEILLVDASLRRRLGGNARLCVLERFDAARSFAQVESLFAKLVENGDRPVKQRASLSILKDTQPQKDPSATAEARQRLL